MATPRFAYQQALQLTYAKISPLLAEDVELLALTGRVAAEDIYARVDAPSADVSLKDGYAVRSVDVAQASPENPVSLRLLGSVAAGWKWEGKVEPGGAVRILSGAPLPSGAQAVVAEEFTRQEGERIIVAADAKAGRNILSKGSDITSGELLIPAGTVLQPAQVGLLAAGGHTVARVIRRPRVAILATGDEVVAPGARLQEGKLYASNLVTLVAWCAHFGMQVTSQVVRDEAQAIKEALEVGIAGHDALLTSGGAWSGDRDLVVRLLDRLGWEKVYHRVRIGPGKAVGFGLLDGKPVFCLPGGPPSNYMAFINLALPGLLKLAGRRQPELPVLTARLADEVHGQSDWTQFVHGRFERSGERLFFHPAKVTSRLQMIAQAEGILEIPEGVAGIPAGEDVPVRLLAWPG